MVDYSIESQVKSMDFDDQIDVLCYELALTDIGSYYIHHSYLLTLIRSMVT
jgi:hypothetical protein